MIEHELRGELGDMWRELALLQSRVHELEEDRHALNNALEELSRIVVPLASRTRAPEEDEKACPHLRFKRHKDSLLTCVECGTTVGQWQGALPGNISTKPATETTEEYLYPANRRP